MVDYLLFISRPILSEIIRRVIAKVNNKQSHQSVFRLVPSSTKISAIYVNTVLQSSILPYNKSFKFSAISNYFIIHDHIRNMSCAFLLLIQTIVKHVFFTRARLWFINQQPVFRPSCNKMFIWKCKYICTILTNMWSVCSWWLLFFWHDMTLFVLSPSTQPLHRNANSLVISWQSGFKFLQPRTLVHHLDQLPSNWPSFKLQFCRSPVLLLPRAVSPTFFHFHLGNYLHPYASSQLTKHFSWIRMHQQSLAHLSPSSLFCHSTHCTTDFGCSLRSC